MMSPPPQPTMTNIVTLVSERTHVSPSEIRGRSRVQAIVHARHLCWYAAAGFYRLGEIATEFRRDHSTVKSGIRKIFHRRASELTVQLDVDALERVLPAAYIRRGQ